MPELLDRLKTALADRYAVKEEVGAGGMATVYLADDLKHGRHVAIKVLRPELAASIGSERFVREIRLTSQLNHPHILPVHDSGDADGFLYYVMPFVDGESLRDRLTRETQLPLDDALQIVEEVADALGYSHSQGIIHRDIKPENILLSGGHAVVADFGIARAITAAGGEKLTQTGMAVGTPAYMSPEQASGMRNLDARVDIYAMGCVLYEMLSGESPYTGPTAQAIIAKQMADPIPSIRRLRPSVPESVDAAIMKALDKVPADRFTTAERFVSALTAEVPVRRKAPAKAQRAWVGALLVAAIAAVAVWRMPFGPSETTPRTPRIAVLPMENIGPEDKAYLSAGITDEVTTRLMYLSGLEVIDRASTREYANSAVSLTEIGEALGATHIVTGTIRWTTASDGSDVMRMSPRLVQVADSQRLWFGVYDRTLDPTAMFEMQAEIAEEVARALDVGVLEPERRALATRPTSDRQAYDFYLRGLRDLQTADFFGDQAAKGRAIELFESAIARDSNFALAYASLSLAHLGMLERSEFPIARALAERALELDSLLPEAHLAIANVDFLSGPERQVALEHLEILIRIQPSHVQALGWLAGIHLNRRNWDEWSRYEDLAADLDPRSAAQAAAAGWAHLLHRRYATAERYFERAMAIDSSDLSFQARKSFLYLMRDGDKESAGSVISDMLQSGNPAAAYVPLSFLAGDFTGSTYGSSAYTLIRDGSYDTAFEKLSPGSLPPPMRFVYFSLKGAFYLVRDQPEPSHAYYDSLHTMLQSFPIDQVPGPTGLIYRLVAAAGSGRTEEALQYAGQLEGFVSAAPAAEEMLQIIRYKLVQSYAMMGEYDAAIDHLEYLLSVPSPISVPYLRVEWFPGELKEQPRFRQLLQ